MITNEGVNTSRHLRRSVREHVQGLGETPAAVAEHLASHRVSGVPGKATDCAVARYLQAVIGAESSVSRVVVMEGSLRVFRYGCHLPIWLRLPRATAAFVRAFDAGCYPELIDTHLPARSGLHGGAGQVIHDRQSSRAEQP